MVGTSMTKYTVGASEGDMGLNVRNLKKKKAKYDQSQNKAKKKEKKEHATTLLTSVIFS